MPGRAKETSLTTEASIVGFSGSLKPLWVDLQLPVEEWAGFTFRLSFSDLGSLNGLDVRRSDDASDLTAHLLQRVPLGALERAARRHIRTELDPFIEHLHADSPARARLLSVIAAGRPNRRDRRESAARLAALAVRYVETLGEPDQMAVLAREFSYEASSIPKLVARARNEHHFLTATTRGRPGGSVTSAAYALLASLAIERRLATSSPAEREAAALSIAASKDAWARFERGEISHEQWELEAFGESFPRDEHGAVHLNFDERSSDGES